jgi:hypothetical protein
VTKSRLGAPAAIALLIAEATTDAIPQSLACHGAEQPREVAELVFGRRIGSRGIVRESGWRRFVAREVTPRFPEGLTILAGNGQWRDPSSGRIMREPVTVVIIAMPGTQEDHDRLGEIAAAYKKSFRQQSVGIIVRPGCVAF